MRTIETSIQIAADPAVVWDILVDLDRYQDWNSFIPSAEGVVRVGGTVLERRPGGGTRLRHREEFRGLLVAFLGRTLRRTEAGFVAMNGELKHRVERDGQG